MLCSDLLRAARPSHGLGTMSGSPARRLPAQVQVDRGAIRFVLKGANIMCPGLTSPGAYMEDGIPAGAIVAVRRAKGTLSARHSRGARW